MPKLWVSFGHHHNIATALWASTWSFVPCYRLKHGCSMEFYNVTNESHKSIILAIILPTLIHLLADPPLDCYLSTTTTPQQKSLPPLHILSMTNILSLATSQSTYFKDAVNLLSPEPKSKLEAAIRFNVLLQQEQRKLHEEREKKINDEVGLSK
ncbi:3825_t:CDS:2, partial [Entrophospora sp. SA101]